MRIALDTSILVYVEGLNGFHHKRAVEVFLAGRREHDILIPVQVLGELFNVLIRKGGMSAPDARGAVLQWARLFQTIDTTRDVLADALLLVQDHRIGRWDAIVFASAVAAGCEELLSEDLQHGFSWRGVTVRNPFAA